MKDITNIPDDYEKLIKPTFRDKKQFGWYIYFGNNKKVEFEWGRPGQTFKLI